MEHEQLATYTNRYRSTVNFNYWKQHAKTEQGKDLRTARELIYKGDRAYADGDQVHAMSYYRGSRLGEKCSTRTASTLPIRPPMRT